MRMTLREFFQASRRVNQLNDDAELLSKMSPLMQGSVALAANKKWLDQIWFLRSLSHELKGIEFPGEIVLVKSDLYDTSMCASANDIEYQKGDYAHPAGSNLALTRLKYHFTLKITLPEDNFAAPGLLGPVANFTVLPPIELS